MSFSAPRLFQSTRGPQGPPGGTVGELSLEDYTGPNGPLGIIDVAGPWATAAADAVAQNKRLVAGPGTWRFDATAFGIPNLSVRGFGRLTKFKAAPGRTGGSILNFTAADHSLVEGIYFDGSQAGNITEMPPGVGGSNVGVLFNFLTQSGTDIWLKNCYSKANPYRDQAIRINQTYGGIIGCVVEQANRDAIDVSGSGLIIGWNEVYNDPNAPAGYNLGDDMIACLDLSNSTIIGNILVNNKQGNGRCLWLSSVQDLDVIGNVFKYGYRSLILIENVGALATDGVLIEGNSGGLVGYNGGGGFGFGDMVHIKATGGGAAPNISRVRLRNNKFRGAYRHGLFIEQTIAATFADISVDDDYYSDASILDGAGVALQRGSGNAINCVNPTGTVDRLRVRGGTLEGFPGAADQVVVSGTGVTNFEDERPAAQALTLANGANDNILARTRYVRITGPTAAFSISSIALTAPTKRLVLYNASGQALTLTNEAGTGTAAQRLHLPGGVNLTLGEQAVELLYDATLSRWVVTSAV